jgi:hypothetical protein
MVSYSWILGRATGTLRTSELPRRPTKSDRRSYNLGGRRHTVTVNTADAANSLTLSSGSATLNDTASLTIGGFACAPRGIVERQFEGSFDGERAVNVSGGSLNVNSRGLAYANGGHRGLYPKDWAPNVGLRAPSLPGALRSSPRARLRRMSRWRMLRGPQGEQRSTTKK